MAGNMSVFDYLFEMARNTPNKEIEIDFGVYEKYQNNPQCAICPYMKVYVSDETAKTKENLLRLKERCKKCEKENE